MKAFFTFYQKEITEHIRTYKLFILLTVFFLFGVMSPLTAKLTPLLLESLIQEGITFSIPTPSAIDSWMQFFKNVSQLGLVVLIILFSGSLTNELNKGTLTLMLTKGLNRRTVILSKYSAVSSLWTACYLLCFLVCFAYTLYFWDTSGIKHLFLSAFYLWFYGLLLLSVLFWGSMLSRNNYTAILFTGCFVLVLNLLNIIPVCRRFNPHLLGSGNVSLLNGSQIPTDFTASFLICAAGIFISLYFSVLIFNKKQI